ncbi:MAG: flagellar biosynthetic protein FliR [Fimbriimonadales bacterium]|nr:flagellar biosynthetic protein FliR [Fimbriimonadales bacterium]
MRLDGPFLFSFFLVFVRCSAMLAAAPVFGGAGLPVRVRVFLSVMIAGALAFALRPQEASVPADLGSAVLAIANEAAIGLVIGGLVSMSLAAAQMAGSVMDIQMGLSMGHILNPNTGTSNTLLAEYKHLLATVVFLCANGHHLMLGALARSFEVAPAWGWPQLEALQAGGVALLAQLALIALQIAAPVLGVSILVDTAFGVVNKAVPQMPIFLVGLPAKILAGLVALSVALPAFTVASTNAVELGFQTVWRVLAAR